MTLTQLSAFVLVARLGSVRSAATALGVSEPAVSQALTALRQHLDDALVVRAPGGMALTPGGSRLLTIAAQMVALGADAEAAVRAAQGGPERLRLVATSTVAEFMATPLVDAFTGRAGPGVEVTTGVAGGEEMPVLVGNRLADVALGPAISGDPDLGLVTEPIFRGQMIAVASARRHDWMHVGRAPWLVDPSGADERGDAARLLRLLHVTERSIRVFPNQTAAWAAAADGAGVAPAYRHLVASQLARRELVVVDTPFTPMETCWYVTTLAGHRRTATASAFRRFLGTPQAMQLMRSPGVGVPPSRFRPPVYVTIWS